MVQRFFFDFIFDSFFLKIDETTDNEKEAMSVNEVRLKRVDEDKRFVVKGTGPESNRTFAIGNEDHTIGNALRHVRFSFLLSSKLLYILRTNHLRHTLIIVFRQILVATAFRSWFLFCFVL